MRHLNTITALFFTMAATTALAQVPPDGGMRHHTPQERLALIEKLGTDLGLSADQAPLYATLKAAAAKEMAELEKTHYVDPFAEEQDRRPDEKAIEADRAEVAHAGSALFATMTDAQKELLSIRWRYTFGSLMAVGGRHARHEPERRMFRDDDAAR